MEEHIKKEPARREARRLVDLGDTLVEDEDYDQAEAMYRKAIELDPEDAHVHRNFSKALEKRGDIDGAIRETREYIRKGDPDEDGDERVTELKEEQARRAAAEEEEQARRKKQKSGACLIS